MATVVIVKTDKGYAGVDEKGQGLALFQWSIDEKNPKESEIWSCKSRPFERLELDKKVGFKITDYGWGDENETRIKAVKERWSNILKQFKNK